MPTVLELTREERRRYIEAARRRLPTQGLSSAEQEKRNELTRRVREAASILKARFGIKHVVLFGSLAHGAWFTPESDVDLAVEGLTADQYWEAWRLMEELFPDRSVDLVEIETARNSLLKAIQRHGVEL